MSREGQREADSESYVADATERLRYMAALHGIGQLLLRRRSGEWSRVIETCESTERCVSTVGPVLYMHAH